MSDPFNKVVKDFAKSLQAIAPDKTSPYDTQAEVRRIEGNTAWVHIPGGVDETPVQLTTNAKKGDIVQVRVSGGQAWITGNATNPPTDDTTAKAAQKTAAVADEHAVEAVTSAMLAQQFADQAKSDAESASIAAGQAWTKAGEAETAAGQAWTRAGDAAAAASAADAKAVEAAESAEEAKGSAIAANIASNSALTQLSVVEDVASVLAWISEHGTYKASADTSVVSGKLYFTKSGNDYNLVTTPTGDPHTSGYYEIDTIGDEAVSNYISSHLALTSAGLWVLNDNSSYKILLSSTGMKVYDASGTLVSTFGESIVFSSTRQQVIGGENNYILFDPTDGSISINGSNVKIGNTGKKLSEVLTDIDISTEQTAGGAIITIGSHTATVSNGATGTSVSSVTPYYLAQASTLSPPTFSVNTISNWSTTEPTLDTSKTCYIAFLTAFSDNTYGYSSVSTMSEYEASKTAYNGVIELNGTVTEQSTVISETKRAVQDIRNGYVRWDATNKRMLQISNSDGTQEITNDFLSGWMQFGLDANNKATLSLGDSSNMTVNLHPDKLSFLQGGVEVAYISNQTLYITQSVVLQQMDVGTPVSQGGIGQWSWKVHSISGKNNLYLKWLG